MVSISKYEFTPDCDLCGDTGLVTVSLASAENGPTNDPRDEIAIMPCECPKGYKLWYAECIQFEGELEAELAGHR